MLYKWKKRMEEKGFLILLLLVGCICLTVTNNWTVYTEPLQKGGKQFLRELGVKKGEEADDTENPSGEDTETKLWEQNPQSGKEELQEDFGADMEQAFLKNPETEPEAENETVFGSVEDDYFEDAVFIGDSRTVGMHDYSNLKETSTFYASVGLTVHKLFSAKVVEVPEQRSKITIEEALSENQFSKIYLMIGINEMGTGTVESFLEKYAECVNHIRELQPDAIIYLQGIMQVSAKRSAEGDYITNEGIALRNEGIETLADGKNIFYLDVNEAVCGEDGALCPEYTGDGVHLKAQYINLWKDYLKEHAVVRE